MEKRKQQGGMLPLRIMIAAMVLVHCLGDARVVALEDSPKPFSGRKTGLFFRNCWQHARPSACPPLLGQGPILLALRGGDGDAEARGKGGSAKDDAEEFERAITELERAKSSGMPLNATSFNNVLTLCWKGGGWKQALELLGEMKRTPGVKPDQRTYNAVMGALARAGQHAIVMDIFKEYQEAGYEPDEMCFNTVICAFARVGKWRRAMEMIHEMRNKWGIAPNKLSYNSVIAACASGFELNAAEKVFGEMKESGVKPDTTTYNAMLSAYCSAEKLEEALTFAEGMRKDGVAPDGVTFNSVLIANSLLRRWDRALTTFEEMRRMGIKPDVLSYNALISALANGGKHARAMQMYESMVRDGIRPDETTHQFVEAIKASAWATGQEELHVDEGGNVEVR